MSDKLKFNLVSPENVLFSGDVDRVDVPGTEGDFGVLARHSPMMAVLRIGLVTVEDDSHMRRFFVCGGFADVTPAGLTLLVDRVIDLDKATDDMIDSEIAVLQEQDNQSAIEILKTLRAS